MKRWAIIRSLRVNDNQPRRSLTKDAVRVTLDLDMSPESLQWLSTEIDAGGTLGDIQNMAESIGLEQPGTKAGIAAVTTEADALTSSATICLSRHSSGVSCVKTLGHLDSAHASVRGWVWRDAAAQPCNALRPSKSRNCTMEMNHHGLPHQDKDGRSWNWHIVSRAWCPVCSGETIPRINSTSGAEFTACSRYPDCRWTSGATATAKTAAAAVLDAVGYGPATRVPRVVVKDAAPAAYAKRDLDWEDDE